MSNPANTARPLARSPPRPPSLRITPSPPPDLFRSVDDAVGGSDFQFRHLGIARLVDAAERALRAGQYHGHRRRRIGEIGAFQLKGGLRTPHAHIGLGVGAQVVDGRDQLRDGFRLGADDLAEFGEIGGHTVGYREVKRTGSNALGDLVNDGARQFFAILAHQHSGQFDFSAGPDFAPSHGNAIDLKLLLGVEGFDIEGDLLYLQRVESALQDIRQRYGG